MTINVKKLSNIEELNTYYTGYIEEIIYKEFFQKHNLLDYLF